MLRKKLLRTTLALALGAALLGGVAAHFEALLREALEAEGRRVETIVESPAEGLLKYHYGR